MRSLIAKSPSLTGLMLTPEKLVSKISLPNTKIGLRKLFPVEQLGGAGVEYYSLHHPQFLPHQLGFQMVMVAPYDNRFNARLAINRYATAASSRAVLFGPVALFEYVMAKDPDGISLPALESLPDHFTADVLIGRLDRV